MQNIILNEADLRQASAEGANARNAILIGADLKNSDFSGANFQRAELAFAQLEGCNFAGATFQAANLAEADGWERAEWGGAVFNSASRLPSGFRELIDSVIFV